MANSLADRLRAAPLLPLVQAADAAVAVATAEALERINQLLTCRR